MNLLHVAKAKYESLKEFRDCGKFIRPDIDIIIDKVYFKLHKHG